MSGGPVEPVPPEAIRGKSDWDDEDLLTVAEASERLAEEISASRRRIRQAEEILAAGDSPPGLAAECRRLDELTRAAERIRIAQSNAPK